MSPPHFHVRGVSFGASVDLRRVNSIQRRASSVVVLASGSSNGSNSSGQKQQKKQPSAIDTAALNALNGALQTISKFIAAAEKRRKERKPAVDGSTSDGVVVIERKSVTFKAGSKGEKLIKEVLEDARPGHALSDYLMLPLDQYSLLDPRWITRDAARPELFQLKVPLDELVGVDLQPQMDVLVTIDEKNQLVKFSADGFKLGDPRFDDNFTIDMKASLRSKPVLDVAGIRIPNFWRSTPDSRVAEAADAEAEKAAAEEVARLKRQAALMPTRSALGLSPLEAETMYAPAASSSSSASPSAAKAAEAIAVPGAAASTSSADPSAAAVAAAAAAAAAAVVGDTSVASSGASSSAPTSSNAPELREAASSRASPSSSVVVSERSTGTQEQPRPAPSPMSSVPTSALCCSVDVTFTVVATPPMTSVPGPLLSVTGGLISRLAMNSLLPAFLELLSVDYEQWASGVDGSRTNSVGSLVQQRGALRAGRSTPAPMQVDMIVSRGSSSAAAAVDSSSDNGSGSGSSSSDEGDRGDGAAVVLVEGSVIEVGSDTVHGTVIVAESTTVIRVEGDAAVEDGTGSSNEGVVPSPENATAA